MNHQQERIELEAPLSGDFQAVVRLIIGGIAERVDFAFEEIDDLQLAVERLLAEAGQVGSVHLSFEVGGGSIRTRVGPLSETAVAEALRDGDSASRPAHARHASSRPWSTPSASRTRATARSSSAWRSSRAWRERTAAPLAGGVREGP